jgi:hypothetical protein
MEGVTEQTVAKSEATSDKEFNFKKLEEAREREREARIKAEMETQYLKQEMENIKAMMTPKEIDPLDAISDDDYADPSKFKAKLQQRLEKERQQFRKEAEEIARAAIEKDRKSNYLTRLKSEFQDFDQVMNEDNVAKLEQANPEFVQSLFHIQDDYERRKLAYKYLKRGETHKVEEKPSIKEKVAENMQNTFYIPSSSGVPTAVDFDLKSPQARQAAYDKLKAAQKRPIGNQTR